MKLKGKMKLKGVFTPIITPFLKGEIDYDSYKRLIEHYISKQISGLIVCGTTGESPVITQAETEELTDRTLQIVENRVPVYLGVGGNFTDNVVKKIRLLEKYEINGILSVCPYYNRPSQNGLFEHFTKISESTDLNIIIYNIPYRTGVNLENETLLKLSEKENIIAVKDASAIFKQSTELLSLRDPEKLSVLTGEDILFYTTLANGGDGGILAASHIGTEVFVEIYNLMLANDYQKALAEWRRIERIIPFFFKEPNPGPLKYCLYKKGLIKSAELRLPLTEISDNLKKGLDKETAGF